MNEEHTLSLEELGEIKTVKVYNQAYVDKQQERIEELEKENAELKEREIKSEMFPEIILPKGSSEFIDKIIVDAEKRIKESE